MRERPRGPSAAAGAVAALAVAAFCYGTTESLPVGLLPVIAGDLHTSLPAAGLLVTGYGATVAVVSVPLVRAVMRVPRRALLSALLVAFVVSTWASVLAPSYGLLLAARLVTALSQAIFWPVATVTAAGMFSPRVRGRAASAVLGGGSLAVVLGVPAGTWIGQLAGWRMAFLALSGLGLLALLTIIVLVPGAAPGGGGSAPGDRPDTRRYALLVVATILVVAGFYTVQTYISVFLTRVSGFPAHRVGALLFVQGVADVAGLAFAGAVVDRGPRRAMIASTAVFGAALFGMYALGTDPWAAAAMMALAGFALPGIVAALQNRVLEVAPVSTDVASAGTSAAFNVGIGGGALTGGLLLPAFGVRATAVAGGALVAAAVAVLVSEPPRAVGTCAGAPDAGPAEQAA